MHLSISLLWVLVEECVVVIRPLIPQSNPAFKSHLLHSVLVSKSKLPEQK